MATDDQMMRKVFERTGVWNKKVDREHTKKMKKIIARYGWPTIPLVGRKAGRAAWLLVQHADHDLAFQKKCLKVMKNLYNRDPNSVAKEHLAYLTDRILVNERKKQLFGTQFYLDRHSKFRPRPIRDPRHLNERRKEYGLGSFKEYLKSAKSYKPVYHTPKR